jgi:hypothetical protein
MLRAQYDAWRATHPCPMVTDDTVPGSDAGVDPEGRMDAGCCSGGRDRTSLLLALSVLVVLRRRRRR